MLGFFSAVFDSFTVLFTAEPVLYCISIIGLAFVLYALRSLMA